MSVTAEPAITLYETAGNTSAPWNPIGLRTRYVVHALNAPRPLAPHHTPLRPPYPSDSPSTTKVFHTRPSSSNIATSSIRYAPSALNPPRPRPTVSLTTPSLSSSTHPVAPPTVGPRSSPTPGKSQSTSKRRIRT